MIVDLNDIVAGFVGGFIGSFFACALLRRSFEFKDKNYSEKKDERTNPD